MELVSYSEVYYGFLVHFPRSAFFGFSLCIMMEYLLSTRDQGTIGGVAVYPLLFYVRKLVGIALLFYFLIHSYPNFRSSSKLLVLLFLSFVKCYHKYTHYRRYVD